MTFSPSLINVSLASVFIYLEPMYSKYNLCKIQFVRKRNHIERSKSRNTLIYFKTEHHSPFLHFHNSHGVFPPTFCERIVFNFFCGNPSRLCKTSDLNVFNIHSMEVFLLDCLKH